MRLTALLQTAESPTAAVELWIATMIGSAARPDLAARARLFSSLGQIGGLFAEQVKESRVAMYAPLESAIQAGRSSGEFPLADVHNDGVRIMSLCGAALRDLLDGRP